MTTQGKILEELGRRAVACKHWRWMPGMTILGSKGRRVVVIGLSGATEATSGMNSRAIGPDELPDLSSPATLGCLLALVREVTGEQSSSPSWYPGGKHDYPHWAWYSDSCYGKLCEGSTEAECLVRVLEYKQ